MDIIPLKVSIQILPTVIRSEPQPGLLLSTYPQHLRPETASYIQSVLVYTRFQKDHINCQDLPEIMQQMKAQPTRLRAES